MLDIHIYPLESLIWFIQYCIYMYILICVLVYMYVNASQCSVQNLLIL